MEFIKEYQKKLNEIYQKEKLVCLSDWGLVQFGNKNALQFASDNLSNIREKININGKLDFLVDDIIYSTSQDIKFSLGNVYLYKELGINNFLKEQIISQNKKIIFSYHQTLADRRFFFYVNTCFEKLYNYWDRIGDLLALSLDLDIEIKNIYFQAVIKKIQTSHHNNKSIYLQFLKNFSDDDYQKILNRIRILIVHYRQKDTYFRSEWIRNISDKKAIAKLQQEKDELPEILKKQMQLTVRGFESAILLIGKND